MPELPEVETVRAGLEPELVGRALASVRLYRRDLRWPIPVAAVTALAGRRCLRVVRRAKYLQLWFSGTGTPVALVHLGMSGRLFLGDAHEPARLHEHWRMHFRGRTLRFVDPRRFGMLDVVPSAALGRHALLEALGPEPLEGAFDGAYVRERTRGKKLAIKSWLMDSRQVAGVGNIYANEALFRAAVRPARRAGRLTAGECERLAAAVREVLGEAIAAGGTTIRDFIGASEGIGYFQQRLRVYGRGGEPCPRCATRVRAVIGEGRATYFCPGCQR